MIAISIPKRRQLILGKEKKMRQFLYVLGPIVGNFIVWSIISFLPIHSMVIMSLAIASGIAMISALIYLGNKEKPAKPPTRDAIKRL
jgi:hypothetical protein